MSTIDIQKKNIRKQIKELKANYTLKDKKSLSENILRQVEDLPEFKTAKNIMLYWSMDDEVYTHDFVCKWAEQKQVILPVVNGNSLDLKVFEGKEHLVAGENYGIPEPDGKLFTQEQDIDLIVVPGVAFDQQNNRMGRGKAYYDRLLRDLSAYKVGIGFHFQILPNVPTDQYDIKMDKIISNTIAL